MVPRKGFAPPDGAGAIDRTRTCYLSLTKRAHYQLCFDGSEPRRIRTGDIPRPYTAINSTDETLMTAWCLK